MEPGTSPRTVTSKRKIVYRKSSWNVHEFEVFGGEPLCRVLALRMQDSLLLWVGRPEERRLGEVALGMPAPKVSGGAIYATLLEGGVSEAGALALRVAAGLRQPVFVCCALPLDRLSAPLLERALATEIHMRPHCFYEYSVNVNDVTDVNDYKDSDYSNDSDSKDSEDAKDSKDSKELNYCNDTNNTNVSNNSKDSKESNDTKDCTNLEVSKDIDSKV